MKLKCKLGKTKGGQKTWLWLVMVMTAVFALLSFVIGLNQSIWFDEAYSVNLAQRSVGEIISLTAVDVHPPLYYLFLKVWGEIFGFSDVALRCSSVFLMSLAVFLAIGLAKILAGEKVAQIASMLLALSPMLIRYGFELRMYALGVLIGVVATLVLWKILQTQQGKKRRVLEIVYAGLVAMGVWTLYYIVIIWFAHLLYLIYRSKKQGRKVWRERYWLIYGLAILMFLPWLSVFWGQLVNGTLAPVTETLNLANLLGIVSFNLFYRPIWQLDQILSLLSLALIAMLIVWRSNKKNMVDESKIFLRFLVISPIILEFLICLAKPIYLERYLVYLVPFMIIYLAMVLKEMRHTDLVVGYLILLLMIGVVQLVQVGNYNFQRLQKPEIKRVVAQLNNEAKIPIIADTPYEAIELRAYQKELIYFYAPYEKLTGGYAPLDQDKLKIAKEENIPDLDCFWYVYYEGLMKKMLQAKGYEAIGQAEDLKGLKYLRMCKAQ